MPGLRTEQSIQCFLIFVNSKMMVQRVSLSFSSLISVLEADQDGVDSSQDFTRVSRYSFCLAHLGLSSPSIPHKKVDRH